jgi:hypothetical protein
VSISSRRAACSTVDRVGGGVDWAKIVDGRIRESSRENHVGKRRNRLIIVRE